MPKKLGKFQQEYLLQCMWYYQNTDKAGHVRELWRLNGFDANQQEQGQEA